MLRGLILYGTCGTESHRIEIIPAAIIWRDCDAVAEKENRVLTPNMAIRFFLCCLHLTLDLSTEGV
jgi:hypothetical protein